MSDLAEGSLTEQQPLPQPTADNAVDGSWEDALPDDKIAAPQSSSNSQTLPTWNQAVSKSLPTWDEALKKGGPSAFELTKNAMAAPTEYDEHGSYTMSPAVKQFLTGTSLGRVMNAFNYNFSEQIGSSNDLGFTKGSEFESLFQKAGILSDVAKNDNSIVSAITDGPVRVAAQALDATMRTAMGAISGAGGALKQIGGPIGGYGEILEAVPEGFGTEFIGPREFAEGYGSQQYAKKFAQENVLRFTPRDFHEAKSAGVMDGADVYMGLKEPTPEQRAAQNASAEQVPQKPEAPTFDIHAEARNIAPEVFNEYDRLSTTRDTLGSWIRDFSTKRREDAEASVPHKEEITELQSKLDDANPRKTKIYQNKIDDLTDKNNDYIQDQVSKDTPELAAVRKRYEETEYRMRDMAPDVSEAYRKANEIAPEEVKPEIGDNNITDNKEPMTVKGYVDDYIAGKGRDSLDHEQFAANNADAIEKEFQARKEESQDIQTEEPAKAKLDIASDVSQKLIAASRSAEESSAAAQLVAAHYQAISEQGWTKLSPEEAYQADMANIRAGRERRLAFAQGGKRGSIEIADNQARNTITLMKSANASTFMHEMGHHWLEEMMAYASKDGAPEQLLSDSKTVRDWLGVKDGEEIPTRAHEKFARGFERYLMEGVAPSKDLARIFAKFKEWLTQIYKTVAALRSPITDDIRDVFDRFLSSSPEKTVIAPDHEIGKMMADIHEADARTTTPENAASVRDNIENEQDQLAKTHNKEAYDALRAADQTGEEPTQTNGPQPTGPEPATGEQGVSAQPTEEQPSGGGTGPESGPTRTGPEPASGSDRIRERDHDNATTPFGSEQSDLVDKAGNIRLDNLNTPEDINELLRETADKNDNFLDARRGVLSASQQLELADALGMQPSDLNFRKIGQAFNAEQILWLRKALIQSASELKGLMSKAANGTDQDVIAYSEAKQRHLMIQEHTAAVTAEAGRALGAFRKLKGSDEANALGEYLKQSTGKDLFQLKEEAAFGAKLETPEQVSMFINATKKATFREMMLEYYINCLISGPITHARYSVGNAINALWTPLIEIPTAAAIGKVREVITGQETPNRVYLGEAGAQLMAIFKGSREGLSAGATAFKTGVSPLLPSEHISDNFSNTKMNAIPGTLGKVINVPGKSVSAIHSFFKSVRYEQNIHGLAYRTAMNEKLDGDAFNNRVSDLIQNPTEAMMKEATSNSLRELYMSPTEYNSFMGSLNRAVNSNMAAKIIVPFMKIGSQITRNAFIERTPIGALSKEVRENIVSNSAATDMQLARIGTGVALIGATSLMTLDGMATGDGPTDPNQRRVWLLNHKPNSIQIGDISIPYQGLGHLGMLMRFSANMTETAKAWDSSDGDKLAKSFFSLFEGINKSVLDENFMRGVKDLLDAVYHPEEYGSNYVRQFATNWLPFSVGMSQVAHKIDPDYREAHTIFEAARAKIPFASEGLQPKRDMFGEPIPTAGSVQNYENDPVAQRMESLKMSVGKLNPKILGVKLNDQQFDDFSRIAGRMAKMRLDQLIANPGFGNLPQHVQIDTIHKLIADSRKTASSIIMMQNPSIMQQARDNKLNALHGK